MTNILLIHDRFSGRMAHVSYVMHPHHTSILTATVCDGSVLLSFQIGAADGITLLSRRASEPDFFAAEDDPSPVVDDRPTPQCSARKSGNPKKGAQEFFWQRGPRELY